MSFQGDVRGLGLAELLQGLARGRKEGVLTLTSTSGLRSTVGVADGQLFLLADPDEDAETWRQRARNAWGADAAGRVDYLRMAEIARAHRLEQCYNLLDADGVHFRFDPGPLPPRPAVPGVDGNQEVHCDGMPVEFLLLEYARLGDELESSGAAGLVEHALPCVLDPGRASTEVQRVLPHCDGSSTLQEVADRQGWPQRHARLVIWTGIQQSALRLALPHEVLVLALRELAARNFSRAASRLEAWCAQGPPGPMRAPEAEAFAGAWQEGTLPAALRGMSARSIRVFLRRLGHAIADPAEAVAHWTEAAHIHSHDLVARLRLAAAQSATHDEAQAPTLRELLELVRVLRERGHPRRTGPALVLAARLQPQGEGVQLEIGQGLVAAGRAAEGAPWILNAAAVLLERGAADRVIGPLRALLAKDPTNRECRQLLGRARRSSTQTKKLRKNLLVGLAISTIVALAALVKLRAEKRYEEKVYEVRELLSAPQAALSRLHENFPEDDSPVILALRSEIQERMRTAELDQREAWHEIYRKAQAEVTLGDPLLGLKRILELPEPPELALVDEPWPEASDLYVSLAQSLALSLQALGDPVEGSPQQILRERDLATQIHALEQRIESGGQVDLGQARFLESLDSLAQRIEEREEQRNQRIEERLRRENLQRQDLLLAQARAYTKSGDFRRALRYYEDLLQTDPEGRIRRVLAPEMEDVRAKERAVQEARQLATEGRHVEAWQALTSSLDNPASYLVPWTVESFPSAARVRLGDGSFRTTPFVIETTYGERVTMTFELEGFEPLELRVNQPGDRFLYLSRTPERAWRGEGRIDAMPVAVDDDHVIVDRRGNVARIGAGGALRWQASVATLSGIARAPVFLPHRPGQMLLVTEEGSAWMIDAKSGALEGPWDLGAPPVVGPYPTADAVRVVLRGGAVATFTNRLKPSVGTNIEVPDEVAGPFRHGAESGLAVRRLGDLSDRLACPWNDWVAEIEDEAYFVFRDDDSARAYSVRRSGEVAFIGWEAPRAQLSEGRLWISDEGGLSAYVPAAR